MSEVNKNITNTAEQPKGGSLTPQAEKQADVQNNQQPEGQVSENTAQTEVGGSVWEKLKKSAGGDENKAREVLDELSKLVSIGDAEQSGDDGGDNQEPLNFELTDEEKETWNAIPGGEKVLKLLEWLGKSGIQNISQQVRQIQEQFLVKQYRDELRELEGDIGRKLTAQEAELMYAVAVNKLNQGKDVSLKDIYDTYIKPLKGASEEEKKRVLAEELNKTKQAPEVEGGGVSAGVEYTPKTYEDYYKKLVERGILKKGIRPQTFHDLTKL